MPHNTFFPISEKEVDELYNLGMELAHGVSPYTMRLYGERIVQIGDLILLRESTNSAVPEQLTLPLEAKHDP